VIDPYYVDEYVTLYHGDCINVIRGLTTEISAIVTDPPYASGSRTESSRPSSGAMVRNARFKARPIENDQMTTTGFVWLIRETVLAAKPMLAQGGAVLSFIDWRQWPQLVGALETCNLRVQNMVVWDKGSIGMGNGFRNRHELILHASNGVPEVADRSTGNVLQFAPDDLVMQHGRIPPTDHPSPKPVALMEKLLGVVTVPGELVLDPFAGGGATLIAAKQTGRHVIGIETSEAHCRTIAARLGSIEHSIDPGDGVLDFGA
jgi:site-specific DNA-methyltransferase (adenine-specific)